MPQFIIHVGPHKTGSTYLQEALAASRPLLAGHGIHYPTLWGDRAHHGLYDALRIMPNPTLAAEFAGLRAGPHPTVLLSGEGLSAAPPSVYAHLRRLVGPASPVQIVYYIRSWAELLPSQWKQIVKGGGTPSWPEFLYRRLANPGSHPAVNFALKLRQLAAFGKDALRIVAYDQVKAAQQDLFSHFAATFLGLPGLPVPAIPRANVSPGTADIEVIRALVTLEIARRNGPIPTPYVAAMVAHYLRRDPPVATPALDRALVAHQASLTIDETAGEMAALHQKAFAEFGACLVAPRRDDAFFEPRKVDTPFIHSGYLLAAGVQREVQELHRLVCGAAERTLTRTAPEVLRPARPGPTSPSSAPGAATAGQVVSFRADGNSDAVVGDGWSAAGQGGRWSAAASCALQLPRPAAPGDYVLAIQARPFVVPGRIEAQRLLVEANGVACGEAAFAAPATVRLTLPWAALRRGAALQLRFRFPDAARPADCVPAARDRRLLGLVFERVSLIGPLPAPVAPPRAALQPAD
jgi:hypothetical protein